MSGRAVVLGGGGVTRVAWEIGLIPGLAEPGADLSEADLYVGTSAGSIRLARVDFVPWILLEELRCRRQCPAIFSPLPNDPEG
jgi:hypothetical protein